jgi:hypothetical protein
VPIKPKGPIEVDSFVPYPPPVASVVEAPPAPATAAPEIRKELPAHIRVMPRNEEELRMHFA